MRPCACPCHDPSSPASVGAAGCGPCDGDLADLIEVTETPTGFIWAERRRVMIGAVSYVPEWSVSYPTRPAAIAAARTALLKKENPS